MIICNSATPPIHAAVSPCPLSRFLQMMSAMSAGPEQGDKKLDISPLSAEATHLSPSIVLYGSSLVSLVPAREVFCSP